MCFSPVEISPLWWCLTWVCDLLSPLGNHLEPLLTFPFPLSHQPVKLKCAAKNEGEKCEPCLQYEPQHSWGSKASTPPPSQALSRSNTSSPSVVPLCRSEICNHSPQSESWRIKARTREKPCADWWDFPFISEPVQVTHPRWRSRYTGTDFNIKVMSS